jgi:Ser/Thr protein kinase RdoA (MazF antagonist)
MNEHELAILRQFCLDAEPASCTPYGCGHINRTYLVATAGGRCYILQKINHHTFRDVAGLMENIELVTEHLRRKSPDPRSVLTLIRTKDGKSYLEADDGYWRVFRFVEDSICLQQPESDADFYESAVGFGTFQQLLSDFPAEKLHETIPNFHNTPDRYRAFHETLTRDPMHRAAQVQPEIEFALARQAEMAALQNALDAGELPLRVTHNDTKLNNVLFDAKTRKALCIIDLDTVMPGSALYDYGDSIRFGAATAAEDERELDKMEMSLERFRVFTRGYVRACPGLTQKELELLPLGAKVMTMECGVRFLTDHIDGDNYFSIHREGQNLDRAHTQFKLVADMERKWDKMKEIVNEEVQNAKENGSCCI